MTQTTFARLAGFLLLFYIVAAGAGAGLFESAAGRDDAVAAKLAGIAQNVSRVHVSAVLTLLTIFAAVVLGVALYAITRDSGPDLAVMALTCRACEGVLNAVPTLAILGMLSLATDRGQDAATPALATLLLDIREWGTLVGATVFSAGSAIFSYLFLRARSIPVPLAWLGIIASVLLVITLPLQLIGFITGAAGWLPWLPMLVFELALAWLLLRGRGISPRPAQVA